MARAACAGFISVVESPMRNNQQCCIDGGGEVVWVRLARGDNTP